MDKPTPKERLEHVLEAIGLIRQFVAGVDEPVFMQNSMIQSAVQYQFLVIGEAVRHIDERILAKYNYPWHIPRSFRNFIIHAYHGIKMERIYFATQNLNPLENEIKNILDNEF